MSDTLSPKQMDEAVERAEADTAATIAANFRDRHAAELMRIAADEPVLVAHVTVGDETLIVSADKVNEALLALHGKPVPGLRCTASIVFDAMSRAEFTTLPEYK